MSRVILPATSSRPVSAWKAAGSRTQSRKSEDVFAARLRTLRATLDAACDMRNFAAHYRVTIETERDLVGNVNHRHTLYLSPELETAMLRSSIGRAHRPEPMRFGRP